MFRQRERFERTDVPRDVPYRDAVAIGVLVAVFVGLVVLVASLWARANSESSVANKDLSASIAAQGESVNPEGYVASSDVFTNVLVLTVDDVDAANPTLTKAQVVSLNATHKSGALATIPLDTKVNDGTSDTTLSELYASKGASACVVPLANAANVKLSHVLLATDDIWDKIAGMKSSGVSALLGSASDVLSSIKTDMRTSQLLDLVELAQAVGIDNLSAFDAPAAAEDDGNGGTWSVIDQTQLGVSLGTLVAAS